jgi:hypothetical protein
MTLAMLAQRLTAAGFSVRPWRDQRLYLAGYGPCIKAYLEPPKAPGAKPCDGARLVVQSSWSSKHSALHAKGVKHAVLQDLFAAGLLSAPPPSRWQDVPLDDRPQLRRIISASAEDESAPPL